VFVAVASADPLDLERKYYIRVCLIMPNFSNCGMGDIMAVIL